jgi:hypothetical protein
MEGKFVSALLGAVEWLGRVNQAAQVEFRQIAQKQSDTAKIELARAEALTKATNATMGHARSALINRKRFENHTLLGCPGGMNHVVPWTTPRRSGSLR